MMRYLIIFFILKVHIVNACCFVSTGRNFFCLLSGCVGMAVRDLGSQPGLRNNKRKKSSSVFVKSIYFRL